jgi:hypothetical protein
MTTTHNNCWVLWLAFDDTRLNSLTTHPSLHVTRLTQGLTLIAHVRCLTAHKRLARSTWRRQQAGRRRRRRAEVGPTAHDAHPAHPVGPRPRDVALRFRRHDGDVVVMVVRCSLSVGELAPRCSCTQGGTGRAVTVCTAQRAPVAILTIAISPKVHRPMRHGHRPGSGASVVARMAAYGTTSAVAQPQPLAGLAREGATARSPYAGRETRATLFEKRRHPAPGTRAPRQTHHLRAPSPARAVVTCSRRRSRSARPAAARFSR